MRWKHLFEPEILKRGLSCYREGRVFRAAKKGNEYTGVVRGSENYAVKARFHDSGILSSLGCSCPHARNGHFCKHMAALLFAVENEDFRTDPDLAASGQSIWKDAEIPETELSEIAEKHSQDYHYFDFPAMIRELGMRHGVWERGKALARSGAVIITEFLFQPSSFAGSGKTPVTEGYVTGEVRTGRGEDVRVRASLSRERIEVLRCSVPGCPGPRYAGYGAKDLCEHEAALVYLIGQYILEKNPGDATNDSGARLLEDMGKIIDRPEEISELRQEIAGLSVRRPIRLEAGMIRRSAFAFPEAVFRVGENRLYRIHTLDEFVQAVTGGSSMRFGQSTVLAFREDRIAEESRPLWNFIKDAVLDMRQQGKTWTTGRTAGIIGESLPLFGERLDRFYELLRDLPLEYKEERQQKRMLTCREMAPDLHFAALRIEGRDETFHGLELMGALPEFFDGRDAAYWVSGKHFNRVPGDFAEAIRPLRESADQGRVRVRIGRKHLESFIYDVLPYLRRFAEVEVPQEEEIRQMLPPRESFRFYLDAAGGTASCRLCAVMPAREENPETETILLPGSDNLTGRREKAAKLVREYFPEVSGDGTLFTTGSREDYLYLLLEEGLDRLLMAGEVQTTDSFRRIRVRRRPGISVGVQLSGDLLQLDLAGSDLTEEEMEEILANYQPKKRFYRLKSGDFINLRDNSIEELEALMEGLRMSPQEFVRGKMHIPAYRTLYLDRMLQQSEDLYTLRDTRFKAMVRAFRNVGDADFAIPEALTGVLRKYQKVGYRWLKTLASAGFGGILADEMGLGKTVQVIALLEAEREAKESGRTGAGEAGEPERTGARSLIVAPASLVYNWGAEAGRFAPKLKVLLITGTQEERAALLADPGDADVLVTSYDLLKRDIDLYSGLDFRYEIIDEAQFIKNHTTAAAKAVKLVNSRVRFALTGTPIENRLAELWSIFDYLMPGFLYSYEEFRRLFENPIVRDGEETASDRLMKMISPFILRRMKRDVLKDLPEKLEEVRYSALEGQQRRLYDAQVLHMRQMLAMESAEDFNRNRMKILAELMRVRQICCDPSLCYADYDGPSAKREAFRELVKSAIDGEHRVLVFSQFTSMLDLLKKDMEKEEISYYCITGATPKEERAELTERFNRGNVPVFFISLRAGGTGLNLTGADVVIHYDPWWNLAVENQATDRAHRIGQQRKVTVYKLVMKGTLEERILAMQEAKKKLAEDILGAEQMGQGAITKEELSELLSGDV